MKSVYVKTVHLAVCLSLAGCVMPPKLTEPVRLSRTFNQQYDRVWQQAVRMIAREGHIITATDKSSGLISYSIRLDGNKIQSYAAESSSMYQTGAVTTQVLIESESPAVTRVTLFSRISARYLDFWTGREMTADLTSKGELEKEFFNKLATAIGERKFEFLGADK